MGRKKKNEKEAFVADLHDIMDGAGTMKDTEIAEAFVAKGWRKRSEGEWRPYKTPLDARQTGWICSNCSSVVYDLSNGDTDFCPNCGAKMKGGAE